MNINVTKWYICMFIEALFVIAPKWIQATLLQQNTYTLVWGYIVVLYNNIKEKKKTKRVLYSNVVESHTHNIAWKKPDKSKYCKISIM